MRWLTPLAVLLAAVLTPGASAQSVAQAEYFFDDPGLPAGSGIPLNISGAPALTTVLSNVDRSGLGPGEHVLYVRTQDAGGAWSIIIAQPFYISPTSADSAPPPTVAVVEFFSDADPGQGLASMVSINRAPLVTASSELMLAAPSGPHRLSIRAQQDDGPWSPETSQAYFRAASVADSRDRVRVDRIETFTDADPGLDLATPLRLFSVNADESATLGRDTYDIFEVERGAHQVFVRARSSDGAYSPNLVQAFDSGDNDGDRVADLVDAFPADRREWGDADGDGIGNNSDPDIDGDGLDNAIDSDDDGDGIPDEYEIENGLDSADPVDAIADSDGDGLTNLREFELGTDPQNPDTDGDSVVDGLDPSPTRVGIITEVPLPDGVGANEEFGRAVSIDGDQMAVGAPMATGGGAVYIYSVRAGEPVFEEQLEIPDEYVFAELGAAVSISDDLLAVGAPGFVAPKAAKGATLLQAAIFERVQQGWRFKAPLTGSGSTGNDEFGASVSLNGPTLAIGAPGDDEGEGRGSGAAYVFELSAGEFTQQGKTKAMEPQPNQRFGASVAFANNRLAVGAPNSPIAQATQGLAELYERIGENLQAVNRVVGSDGATGSQFGASVQLQGDELLVGAPGDVSQSGSVYFFDAAANGTQTRQLRDPQGQPQHRFGSSLFAANELLAVGAPGAGAGGAVFLYNLNVSLTQKGIAPGEFERIDALAEQVGFGASVALFGNRLLIGAPQTSGGGSAALEADPRLLFKSGFE